MSASIQAAAPQENPGVEKLRAEAENTRITSQTLIVKSWPTPELADRLIYIGLGALSTGGAAYVLTGYPGLTTHVVPSIFSWVLGLVLLAIGVRALAQHDRIRMRHFLQTFKVQDEEVSEQAPGGLLARVRNRLSGRKGE